MDFQVFYTEPALADLEAVMLWSWRNHPGATERFGVGLLNHVDLLKDFPYLGVPLHDNSAVRRLHHSPLYVYYRALPEARKVEILSFRHVARKPPSF